MLSSLKPGYLKRPGTVERPLLSRMFLHAERVRFADVDGAVVDVEAPLPDDLAMALAKVEKYDRARRPSCD
jgi:hypothetical protein